MVGQMVKDRYVQGRSSVAGGQFDIGSFEGHSDRGELAVTVSDEACGRRNVRLCHM
jgi:hypothetical protein